LGGHEGRQRRARVPVRGGGRLHAGSRARDHLRSGALTMASLETRGAAERGVVLSTVLAALLGAGLGGCRQESEPPSPSAPEPAQATSDALLLSTGQSIVTGMYFSCALIEGGAVKCWGQNGFGQLGLGDTNSRGDNLGETGNALRYLSL